MMIWYAVTYVECCIVLLALISNFVFTLIIYEAKSLTFHCRGFLYIFSLSMFLLTTSHALTLFEFLVTGQTYEIVYFVHERGVLWRTIHEFAYCLNSLALLMFSVERLVAGTCDSTFNNFCFKLLLAFCLALIFLISAAFTYTIHLGGYMFLASVLMESVDLLCLFILIVAWRNSLKNYKSTVGYALERRYQLSEAFTWSRTFIPGALLASWCKLTVVAAIWVLITSDFHGNEAGIFLFVYNNILNFYTVILPFFLYVTNKKIRQRLNCYGLKRTKLELKTLQGKSMGINQSSNDYFNHLNETWK